MVRADSLDGVLRSRLDEIEDLIRPYETLLEERKQIQSLLSLRSASTPISAPAVKDRDPVSELNLPPMLRARGEASSVEVGQFRADTKTARLLDHARLVLENAPAHEMAFIPLFETIPRELLGDGRHTREHFRAILQRAGGRVGIEYVDASQVRYEPAFASLGVGSLTDAVLR